MRLYRRKQLEIFKLAGKDETRIALQGIHIDRDTTTVTDGHKLISVTSQPQPQEDWPANGIAWQKHSKPFVLPKELVEQAIKNLPKGSRFNSNKIIDNVAIGHKEEGEIVCQTTDLQNTNNIEGMAINPEEHRYPDFKQVIPDYEDSENYACISVNAHYLEEISKLFKKYSDTNCAIKLYIRKKYTPLNDKDKKKPEDFSMVITAIDSDDTKGLAVIMPLNM